MKINSNTYVLCTLLISASLFVIFLVPALAMPFDDCNVDKIIHDIWLCLMFVSLGHTIVLAFVYLFLHNNNVTETIVHENPEDPLAMVSGMPRNFSFNDLKLATANFSKKLGRGGFGSVFEGNLGNVTKIAVKQLDQANQGTNEFLAEVKTIGSLHHVNLVRLIGFCAEDSHRLLVYEYMCNGSLDKWIFHRNQESPLDWPTRRKIILHIAQGLSYLHRECRRTIIHLDIKPQNILLDANFNARVADFGLARFIETDQSHVSTVLKGTPGYWAPEWWLKKKITEKADVYSFGVVVLEIMCGRKNVDHSLTEEEDSLLYLVKTKAEEGQLFDVVDKQSDDVLQHKDEAVRIIKTAISCLQIDSADRPSMSTVVYILEGLMDIETISDYSFLTWTPMEPPRGVDASDFTPLLPEILSGPR
ncbi:hypothetical protein AQUCO_03900054v1 [Aquilegia coerulea]|uniref:non-specific serine/threonine protein kinase n=1 Tax=Aquilegia coerulea TaxID=218851 RepID=A0A2G5CRJ1_AQUCA|nr:hypothetical protein AQUCO_03900054v1 [Aquilegia coerulea]